MMNVTRLRQPGISPIAKLALGICAALVAATSVAAPPGQRQDARSAEESVDRRTPLERYQGAYLGAWLMCTLVQKKLFLIEKAKAKGVALDPKLTKDTDISSCQSKGLAEMKKEYTNVVTLVKNEEGKKALLDHYVAAVIHVKEAQSRATEDDQSFTARMNANKRKTDELWVRFEVTQP